MIDKKQNRLRRARATRARIKDMKVNRLTVHRTNLLVYPPFFPAFGKNVLCAASTLEPEVRAQLAGATGKGGNVNAAKLIGTRIAEKAKAAGIESCAFDRAGYRFHGRIAALANAAREAGLKF